MKLMKRVGTLILTLMVAVVLGFGLVPKSVMAEGEPGEPVMIDSSTSEAERTINTTNANGYVIDGVDVTITGGEYTGRIAVVNDGSLTIKGGTFSGEITNGDFGDVDPETGEMSLVPGGTITVQSGTINGNIQGQSGTVNIQGGTVNSMIYGYSATINVSGGTFVCDYHNIAQEEDAKINISGGTFTDKGRGEPTGAISLNPDYLDNVKISGGTFKTLHTAKSVGAITVYYYDGVTVSAADIAGKIIASGYTMSPEGFTYVEEELDSDGFKYTRKAFVSAKEVTVKSGSAAEDAGETGTEDSGTEDSKEETKDAAVEAVAATAQGETAKISDVSAGSTVSTNAFAAAKAKGVNVEIKPAAGNATWFFQSDALLSEADLEKLKDFNPEVKIGKVGAAGMNANLAKAMSGLKRSASAKTIEVDFSYDGTLPGAAEVTLDLSSAGFAENKTLYLYYFNGAKNAFELSGSAKYSNGLAKFKMTHCSDYVVTDTKLASPKTGSPLSPIVIAMLAIMCLAGAALLYFSKEK